MKYSRIGKGYLISIRPISWYTCLLEADCCNSRRVYSYWYSS